MIPFVFSADPGKSTPSDAVVARLDASISSRHELFGRLSAELMFPEYFGRTWDSLDDCLRDLHWIEQKRVAIVHSNLPRLPADDLRTYVDVLARAIKDWQRDTAHELIAIFPNDTRAIVEQLFQRHPSDASN
jgi:RNAse (barnase) inhibitor barstar